jgi:hypothetical protein
MSGVQRIYRRNPLAFPGRAPGFDPSHPASTNVILSAIARADSAAFTNLLNGIASTTTGTISSRIDSIGPAVSCTTTLSAAVFNSVTLQSAPAGMTFAAIFMVATVSDFLNMLFTDGNNALQIGVTNYSKVSLYTTTIYDGLQYSYNVPYFLAISITSGAAVFVLKNLSTGSVISNTLTSVTMPTGIGNGINLVGRVSYGPQYLNGIMAAAMYSEEHLSLQQLLAWAADPWSFWYPATVENLLFRMLGTASGGGAFTPKFRKTFAQFGSGIGHRQRIN